jgi:hypothetical protein
MLGCKKISQHFLFLHKKRGKHFSVLTFVAFYMFKAFLKYHRQGSLKSK